MKHECAYVMVMDYKKLGLRVGLEVHQQLDSRTKLFCRCPLKKSDDFPISVSRKMVPVQSELGEEDPAAIFEYLRNRTFLYRLNPDTSCLVEMDEAPPLSVNQKALKTAVQISKMLNCTLVDEIYFMRKTVIDGSAVSGFQRTALIAADGLIETSFGNLGIQTVGLEEDSGTPVKSDGTIEYRLDRLGVPLVEIATGSSINSPEQAKEAAEKIGLLLRSLDVVRGIGSIRQDVNISIEQGSRVEIKGFQELDKIPDLVENEVARQLCLLEIRDELKRRGFSKASGNSTDVTDLFRNTKSNFIRKALAKNNRVFSLIVPEFSGLLKKQCGDRTFGKELSAYPASYGFGIIHSDEDVAKYGLAAEFRELKKTADEGDLVLIIVGNSVEKAVSLLVDRINHCAVGVPEETRAADGTGSKYARPLPGSGRLYPESDVPPVPVTKELSEIETPKTLEEREQEMIGTGLRPEFARQMAMSKYYPWFDEIIKKYNVKDAGLVAVTFLSTYKHLRRKGFDMAKVRKDDLAEIFRNIEENEIPKSSLTTILEELASGIAVERVAKKYSKLSDEELKDIVKSVIGENKDRTESALIGIIVAKTKGRADGKKVAQFVKKLK